MAKIAIIGAGFAGHTAALYLGDKLGADHEITVINRSSRFGYVPSWVWVAVGHMDPEKTMFELEPVYEKFGIKLVVGSAEEVHPDPEDQYVMVTPRDGNEPVRVDYDYLIIATGARLNFAGTPGLGPETGNTWSICTRAHAVQTSHRYLELVDRMKAGEKQKIVVGTGHPGATCQGAAFEYVSNIHKDLVQKGIRDRAEIIYLSNEPQPGDFGVRGVQVFRGGKVFTSAQFIGGIFKEFGIIDQTGRGVKEVQPGKIFWEDLNGVEGETEFDFAMLVPQFLGTKFKYIGKNGEDVSEKLMNAGGFVLVDAIYGLEYEILEQTPEAWPSVYQNRYYRNIFAAGIAFAPPGPISRPHITPTGFKISPAPPRTGMISGVTGRVVALNVADLVIRGRMTHHERMTEMVAACIASMGDSLWDGSAATIVMYPVVPDMRRYPNEGGRDMITTHMEMGLSGAWMKRMLHTTFIHKLRGRIGWQFIPE